MQSKLEELSANIQNHIYNNFIQPSIEKFNQKLNNNVSEVKKDNQGHPVAPGTFMFYDGEGVKYSN